MITDDENTLSDNWSKQVTSTEIERKNFEFRGQYVMIDRDLSELYGVTNKRLNEQVKRNIERFPKRFMFQLSIEEKKQLENEKRFEYLFSAIEKRNTEKTQGIFFDGQVYDAYSFAIKLIKKAKHEIVLIDGYVNNEVLDMLSKKQKNTEVNIYTFPRHQPSDTDIKRFNAQYPAVFLHIQSIIHDRFLILDRDEMYCIGASLKDLGKKCFSFTLMKDKSLLEELLKRIQPRNET
jgi:hypothetical protein